MAAAPHRGDLGDRRDGVARRCPDGEAEGDGDQQPLDELLEVDAALHAAHPQPEVVVRAQEQVADESRLEHEQPGEGAAHHLDAQRLAEGVDLGGQVVARERQGQEGDDGDEVADVTHPVEVGPLLVRLRLQVAECRVGGGDRAAEGDVRDDPVDVDRHPGEVEEGVPEAEEGAALRDGGDEVRDAVAIDVVALAGRHHEGQPGVRDEHDRGADDVQHEAEEQVHLRPELAPAVVVAVEEQRLQEEQQDVGQERRREDVHQVVRELRVEDDQREGQERPEGGGHRERDGEQLRELVRELVVALLLLHVADELDDEGEQRHREDERREQQVELRQHPHGHPAADERHRAVLGLLVGPGPRFGFVRGLLVGDALLARHKFGLAQLFLGGDLPVRLAVLVVHQETAQTHRDDHGDEGENADAEEDPVSGHLFPGRYWRAARSACIVRRSCCSSRTYATTAQRSSTVSG